MLLLARLVRSVLEPLARFILGPPWQGVFIIALCCVLPLAMVGMVFQTFVTLRQGPTKGLVVGLGGVLAGAFSSLALTSLFAEVDLHLIGQYLQVYLLILLPLLGFAVLLRKSVSLNLTTQVMTLFVMLVFIVCYTGQIHILPEAALEQVRENTARLIDVIANSQTSNVNINQDMIKQINQFTVSIFEIISFYFMYLTSLMLARAYQSYIFMPGAFAEEFHNLQCGSVMATALVSCWLLLLLPYNIVSPHILSGVLVIGALWLIVVGAALVHWLVAKYNISKICLAIFYLLFFVPILSSFQLFILMIIGLIDGFVNFRALISRKKI